VAALDVGRVCIKIAGREAGKYCVVINKIDDNFVSIDGPKILTGVKRRRCNIEHLEPTKHKLKIKSDASGKEIIDAYKSANLLSKFGLGKPSPEVIKEAEKKAKKVKKVEKPEKVERKEKEPKEKPKKKKEEKVKKKKAEAKPKAKKAGKTEGKAVKKVPAKRKGKKK
jgi:large subunit ribosomal protein L14e